MSNEQAATLPAFCRRARLEGRPALALGPQDGGYLRPSPIKAPCECRLSSSQEIRGDRHHDVASASLAVLTFEASGQSRKAHESSP